MAYTLHDLKSMTVAQLREIAKGSDHDSLKGYSVMHKDHLIPAICKVFGIDMHEHHEVVGLNKAAIKAQIKERTRATIRCIPFDFEVVRV